MHMGLKDKVAIVAASSEGIGRAAAEGLAAEGAKLALCSRDDEKLARAAAVVRDKYDVEVFAQTVDVRSSEAVSAFVQAVSAKFGRIDVCVTNSGGPPAKPFLTLSDDEWKNGVDLCLMSHVYFCRAVIPLMQQQHGGGSIIMISSLVVKQPEAALVLSSAIRPAIPGLVKTLAQEFGADNIRVNNVGPGYTMTARQEELAQSRAAASGRTPDEIRASWSQDVPLARTAQPQEIADAVVWLASDRSSYVTGQTLIVDGGKVRGL